MKTAFIIFKNKQVVFVCQKDKRLNFKKSEISGYLKFSIPSISKSSTCKYILKHIWIQTLVCIWQSKNYRVAWLYHVPLKTIDKLQLYFKNTLYWYVMHCTLLFQALYISYLLNSSLYGTFWGTLNEVFFRCNYNCSNVSCNKNIKSNIR